MRSTRKTAKPKAAAQPLLAIQDLKVRFDTPHGSVEAVRGVTLELAPGETLGIVGESGSGKSQLLMAALGLLPSNGHVQGSVRYEGTELIGMDNRAMNDIRGRRIGMVFQDPMSALTPHLRIGTQLMETFQAHERLSRQDAETKAAALLGQVQIADQQRVLRSYPHELSGGMRQRVMLAIALACGPRLLIADEPTTALDVTVQAQLLALLADLKKRLKLGIILVSHDLTVVSRLVKRVAVMYAGRVVESGTTNQLFRHPRHPYTQALLAATPALTGPLPERLITIPGAPPMPGRLEPGCAFAPRCPKAIAACRQTVPALPSAPHAAACLLVES